jgi:hemolysin D
MRVDPFPPTRYGLFHGRVLSVSQDAIVRDKPQGGDRQGQQAAEASTSEPKGQELVYAARVSLERKKVAGASVVA